MKIVKVGDVWVRADLIRTITVSYVSAFLAYVRVSIDGSEDIIDTPIKVEDSASNVLFAANDFCAKLALNINSK